MEYKLTRKKIKRIILRLTEEGEVKISAPFSTPLAQIESFLRGHQEWIEKTKKKILSRSPLQNPFQEEYHAGQTLSIFGSPRILHLEESQLPFFHLTENKLYIFYNKEEKKVLSEKIRSFLLETLLSFLEQELNTYSKKLNLFPESIKIKTMKSAWGIYHRRGNYISFNTLLLAQSKEFISYVVVHELCHIRFLHHQKEFWSLVATEIPNYLEIKKSSRS